MKRRSAPRARGITGSRYAENLRKLEIRHGQQTSLNQKQAAQANENAEKARKQAAELLLQQEQLKQENMQTAMALQLESTERKKGQAELSDRSINSARLKDEMSKYAGTRVLTE